MRSTIFFTGLAGVLATPAMAQQANGPVVLPDATLLEISAVGKVSRPPDLATIRAGVVTQAATAAGATGANATRMARVVAALRAAGIADRDLMTSAVSLSPQYRYAEKQPPAITGYQASNSITVRFRDIAKSGRVLDALVQQGANQIDGPTLSLDKPDEALDAARSDAIARARARAEMYAKAAGMRVDRIVTISEAGEDAGPMPPPMPYRARMVAMAAAAPDTQVLPGETDVTATLSVRFLLK